MQRGYEALVGGEALYEEIDAEQGRSNIDTESTCGALSTALPSHADQHWLWSRPGTPVASVRSRTWQPAPVGLARLVTLPRRSLAATRPIGRVRLSVE
jgi:hypothetical protein